MLMDIETNLEAPLSDTASAFRPYNPAWEYDM